MKECHFENEFTETWLEDGIIHLRYKTNLTRLNIKVAKIMVEDRIKAAKGIARPCLVYLNMAIHIDAETRAYFAEKGSEGNKLLTAGALLVDNRISLAGAKLYAFFNRPAIPTKVFLEKEKALEWLQQFKSVN